jgi:hypothetical protein
MSPTAMIVSTIARKIQTEIGLKIVIYGMRTRTEIALKIVIYSMIESQSHSQSQSVTQIENDFEKVSASSNENETAFARPLSIVFETWIEKKRVKMNGATTGENPTSSH